MKFDQITAAVLGSDLASWNGIVRGGDHTWFYKDDVNLRVETSYDGADIQADPFVEDWANSFPDSKAVGYFYNVYYGSTLVKQVVLVAVDGGRAQLPLPGSVTKKVEALDYRIAEICQNPKTLGEYMGRSGLTIA